MAPERAAALQRVAFALQVLLAARSDIPRPMAVSPERAASAPQVNRHDANDGGGAQTEERVRFVYGFVRRSKSSTGMGRAHWFSGASGGRRSASAAVDGATAIPI